MSQCRSSSTSVDSFNFVASSPLIGQGDQGGTPSSTQKGACKQFALRLSLFFITWPACRDASVTRRRGPNHRLNERPPLRRLRGETKK